MINPSATAYRHYITAGNNTVVYTRLSTGTNSTYYLTKDHLGSSAVITDQSGTLLVKEKYSALGWNENTVGEQSTMAGITRHEFTGHEGLDNAGLWLVNMNGRIYVPSGSMFLSPDPRIPHPGNTQSYNRYSYVNNNPLTLIDPTGFDDCPGGGNNHGTVGNGSGAPTCNKWVNNNSATAEFDSHGGAGIGYSCTGNCGGGSRGGTVGATGSQDSAQSQDSGTAQSQSSQSSQNPIPTADQNATTSDTPVFDAQQKPVGPGDTSGAGENAQRAIDAAADAYSYDVQKWNALQQGQVNDASGFAAQEDKAWARYYTYCGCSAPSL
jgi:RHS repeat-associated protein